MKRIMAIVGLLLLMLGQTVAEEHLVMHFDFENVDGKNVTDPVSGITAMLMNQASVEEMSDRHVLNLGNGTGYLDMTKSAGEVVRNLTDYTVSVCYRVEAETSLSGAGYFLWCFSQSAANTQTASPYTAYRLNAQRMASSTGGWGSEVGMEVGSASEKGRWMHVLYRQSGQKGELFIDGKRMAQATNMPVLKNALTDVPAYCWIGRPPFSGDSYLKQTLVSDFRVYDAAVSDEVVSMLAAEATTLEQAYYYGTPGDFTALQAQIATCGAFVASAGSDYASNAIAELQDIINIATIEVEAKRASQTLIDRYVEQLTTLLKRTKATKGYTPKTVFAPSADRGFIHPGGLHTQEDFDRVKEQLEAGNTKVKQAWQKLAASEYSQSSVQTYPTEIIVRGGGNGENYMNAARGAAMAYQNALRWKIAGTKANANAAVRILMQWARTTKGIGGDSNYALAAGLYGYQFAQAAELMRDYEGWSREDFEEFKRWMLTVWYPSAIGFLRGRNGTWENADKWWRAPGHYWSNWGLCNALCVISIGILCDDVFIYNQGMSFIKYDQCGTFCYPRTETPIKNDGLTEFLGNFVVTTYESELETGAYGRLGQLNESGRDAGHSSMSLGVMLDVAKVVWNQGDDLFAYMNHRLAAGIEYLAAQSLSIQDLPWVDYIYGTNGYYYTDSRAWTMTGPAMGAQMRPYWGTVIGIYEGVKGVVMPFAEQAYANMGIDGGGQGSTSGGYDHLGFSVLMNTRDVQLCPADQTPTELTPKMEYGGTINASLIPSLAQEKTRGLVDGKTIYHNELGGLVNTYTTNNKTGVPAGIAITLMPQLPEGEEDTGLWEWNTGVTGRELSITADKSYIYRVTYTNRNGVKSQLAFSIFVQGDALADTMTNEVTVDGQIERITEKTVLAGTSVILYAGASSGWSGDYLWDNGQTGSVITIPAITTSRNYTCQYANQGGAVSESRFNIHVVEARQIINGVFADEAEFLPGSRVEMRLAVPSYANASDISWKDGTTGETCVVNCLTEDTEITATYKGTEYRFVLRLMGGGSYPVNATSLIVNPDFATIDGTGWTMTGTWGNQRFNGAVEVWHSTSFDFSQTISGLPDGEYTVSCQLVNGEGGNTGYLYATSGSETSKATVKQSCAGSDFNTQRDRMAANANYARLSVTVSVIGGTLTIGIKDTSSGTNWLVWDNFTLTCDKGKMTGIQEIVNRQSSDWPEGTIDTSINRKCYNLQGCQVDGTPQCGIYIIDGKKVFVK